MTSSKNAEREQILTDAVEDERGRVLSVITGMIRDRAEAEDILQDVFEEFVEAYELGEALESVGAWLVRVAKNKVIDRFRRRKTQDEYRFLIDADTRSAATSPDPSEEWMRDWLRTEISNALETLPPEQRDVFIQHELEGKSFEEIANATGVSVNTLLSRKRYAVQSLRDYLKEIYDEL